MIESIDKYLPKGTKRVFPDGGLFTWVELPENINTTELLKEAVEHKAALLQEKDSLQKVVEKDEIV